MKAYLEIELPESCSVCMFKKAGLGSFNDNCFISNHITGGYTSSRHPDCPLIVRGVCATCNKKNNCDHCGESVVECECWEIKREA